MLFSCYGLAGDPRAEKLQTDGVTGVLFHQVNTINNFNPVFDRIDLIEHFTVNGQLRVTVNAADFGGIALAGFPLAGNPTSLWRHYDDQLNGLQKLRRCRRA